MKKIACIELDTHAEVVRNFYELMMDMEDFDVDYFLSPKIAQQVNFDDKKVTIVTSKNVVKVLSNKHYDLVIIGTLHRYFNVFKQIITRFPTSVIVHNLNFSKATKQVLFQNIFKKDFVFRLKLALKEGLFLAPKLYQITKFRLVLDASMQDEKSFFFPILCAKYSSSKEHINEALRVVIPGTVSQNRRDYHHVLEKLKTFSTSMEIYFLGKAGSKEFQTLQEASSTIPSFVQLYFYSSKVNENDYDKILQSSSVLWCPIQERTEFFSIPEFYGKTKMSGNIGDAIKYCKTAIFPSFYTTSYPFVVKENDNIEEQIIEVSDNTNDFTLYKKENVQEQLKETLNKLISAL